MTALIGRNSSGKSNALDGLEVLSRLATGADIVDALDSRRGDEGPLRGGVRGSPPRDGPIPVGVHHRCHPIESAREATSG